MGLTARSAALTALMTLVTLGVIGLALSSFANYRASISALAEQQTRGLLTASRLLQQSESLVASSAMLLLADSHFHRRQALFEIHDRRDWIERLALELAELRDGGGSFDAVERAGERLGRSITELDGLVAQRIDLRRRLEASHRLDQAGRGLLASVEAQIAEVIRDNRELSTDLGVAVGFHVGDMRHEIQETVEVLEADIDRHETILKLSVPGVLLVLLATVLFIHRAIVRRVVRLQHAMGSERPVSADIDIQGGDEIARMAATIRHYVDRINDNERRILAMNRELDFLATHDALTQLYNRHFFEQALNERREALRVAPFCVAMLDIDHFKQVNDRHGHAVGDAVIRHVAGLLHKALPDSALLARYGGEEFVVLLPDTELEAAAERLREIIWQVAETPLMHDGEPLAVTLSAGLAPNLPGGDIEQSLKAADESLYAAKRAGRNRLVVRPLRHDDRG